MKNFWSKIIAGFVTLSAILTFGANAYAADLGGNPDVTLTDDTAGNTATYTVSFKTSATGAIPASGRVDVVYPAGFNVSGTSLGTHSANLGTTPTLAIVGQTIRITLGADGNVPANTNANFQLVGVINHQTAGDTYALNVQTYNNLGALIDGPTNTNQFSIQPRAPNQAHSSITPSVDTQVNPSSVTTITITSRDEYNNVTPNQDVLWTISNTNFTLDAYTGTTNASGQNIVHLTAPATQGQVTEVTADVGGVVTHITLICGDIYVTHGPVTSITIAPVGPINLTADQTQIFTATAHDAYGNTWDVTSGATWHENDPAGSFTGNTYNAGTVGSWTIYASYSGMDSNNVTANITHGAAVSVTISPSGPVDMNADQSQAFTATATDADGNNWNATSETTWHENDPAGSFASNTYNAGRVGSWTIYGSIGAINSNNVTVNVSHGAAASIGVTPVGPVNMTADQEQDFTATATDADGNTWDISGSATWNENDPVGHFSGNTFYAGRVGTWTIYATYNALTSNNVTVNVSHGAAVDVIVTPDPVYLTADQTQQFTAVAYDNDGNAWNITNSATWSTDDPWGTVNTTGLYSAGQEGDWSVIAEYSGISDSACVHIAHGAAISISISPAGPLNLTADNQQDFYATARDTDGNTWDITSLVAWHENDPWGSFTNNTYYAGQVGTWTIYATYNTFTSNNVTVNVSHGAAVSLSITPADVTLTSDQTQQFTATATDTDGNTWNATSQTSWSDTDPVGTINSSGLYSAGQVGNWQVNGTYNGTSDFADVHVTVGALHHINITPNTIQTITAGQTVQFTAQGYDADNNPISGLTYSWNNATAGLFNNTVAGAYTVYSFIGGIQSNNVTVNVNPGALHYINITPNTTQTITAGQTVQFTVQGYDSYNNAITGLTYTWTNTTSSGLFNTTTAGTYAVQAHSGGINSNSVNVTVNPGAVDHITITPNTTQTITAGNSVTFTATVYDLYNNVITGQVISWNNATNGLFNNTTKGTYDVYVYIGSVQSNHVSVIVNPGALYRVSISASSTRYLTAGETYTFTVASYDYYGNTITGQTYTWDGTSASSSGLFNNTTAGTYYVQAHNSGVNSNIVMVEVSPAAINHIHITPDTTQSITAGQTVTFTAAAHDQYHNVISNQTFSWNNASNGIFNTTVSGSYSIYAYVGGIESTHVTVNVNPGALHHINITPSTTQTIVTGATVQFTAQGYDAYNNAISALVYTWDNTNASGLFSNTVLGTYAVQAHSAGINSNTVNVSVIAAAGTTEDNGQIKGTDITTLGQDQGAEETPASNKNWIIFLIGLGAVVLAGAYLIYSYFTEGSSGNGNGGGSGTQDKEDKPKLTDVGHTKPSEQTRW